MPVLLRLFQKIEDGTLSTNQHYTLIPRPYEDTTRKNYRPISLMNTRCKNPQQNISKLNSILY